MRPSVATMEMMQFEGSPQFQNRRTDFSGESGYTRSGSGPGYHHPTTTFRTGAGTLSVLTEADTVETRQENGVRFLEPSACLDDDLRGSGQVAGADWMSEWGNV